MFLKHLVIHTISTVMTSTLTYKKKCKEKDEAGHQLLFDAENSPRKDKEGPDFDSDDDISDTNDDQMILDFFEADGTNFRVQYVDSEDSGSDDEDNFEII